MVATLGIGVVPAAWAAPTVGNPAIAGIAGSRPNATRLPVQINDKVNGAIDVGTGNFSLEIDVLKLPGVGADIDLGVNYNSTVPVTGDERVAPRWDLRLGTAGLLSTVPSGIMYTTGDGYAAIFTPKSGSSTAYNTPLGSKASLVKNGAGGWDLFSNATAETTTFNSNGQPVKIADRNSNTSTITWSSGNPIEIVSTKGSVGARTAKITYTSLGVINKITQTSDGVTKTASFTRDTSGNLTGFTDFAGATTNFTYIGGRINKITSPAGGIAEISYDSLGRATKIERKNSTPGAPGNSISRLSYPSATQTLLAGPNTDPAVPVADVPHTTYSLTADKRVSRTIDPMGREKSKTYTPDFDTLTSTRGAGTTAGTTTNTYGANDGQSLTETQQPGGSKTNFEYDNIDAASKYLPSSIQSDAGNQTLFAFNGTGNALTSIDASGATATLTYNSDGTVATALAPGNGANKTVYSYNTNHELIGTTPVTGSSLGTSSVTYDSWGQAKKITSAPGVYSTYSYDAVGRLAGVSFSDSTPAITYAYNGDGQVVTREDGTGTTTYEYDQMGRLISRTNTAGGGTVSYTYDKASNLTSTSDTRGTTSYTYDDSGIPTTLVYLHEGGPKTLAFATDNQGRRTDTWLEANASRTNWKAHTHTDYDTSGRVSRITAAQGTGNSSHTVTLDMSYCHVADTTAPNCTKSAANDRSNIQWIKNNLTGDVTTYTYDSSNRLTKAKISGGSSTPVTYEYSYDQRGNRLTAKTIGSTTTTQSLTANAANQISNTGYAYDGSGNLTQDPQGSYTYNAAQQMTKVTKGGSNFARTYAGLGQSELITQQNQGANLAFTYGRTNRLGLPIVEQVIRNGATAYIENDPVTGTPLMLRTSTGMQSLYIYDGTGNPAGLITSAAYEAFAYNYDPFGVPTLTANSGGYGEPQNPYLFKNGIRDRTTGWLRYGARYYNPSNGRWTQQDTLDAPFDPSNANRYSYAANNPTNFVDPTGLITEDQKNDIAANLTCGVGFTLLGIASVGVGIVGGIAACGFVTVYTTLN